MSALGKAVEPLSESAEVTSVAGLYQTLITTAIMLRTVSAPAIEQELLRIAGLEGKRAYLGGYASDLVMDINLAGASQKLATLASYGCVWLTVIAYTAYVVGRATTERLHWWELLIGLFYALLLALAAWSWQSGQARVREHRRQLQLSAKA